MKKIRLIAITAILISIVSSVFAEPIKVFFSPDGGCQQAVIDKIDGAVSTIDVAMYHLTSREIAQALIKAKERGVIVRLYMDRGEANTKYSKATYLTKKGVEVKYYLGKGLMHNKFAVIDNNVLITGSFNWTPTADRENQENLLILTTKDLIKQYSDRFEMLWGAGGK